MSSNIPTIKPNSISFPTNQTEFQKLQKINEYFTLLDKICTSFNIIHSPLFFQNR